MSTHSGHILLFLLKQKKKRNKTKEKRKELVVQEARCINKTKKRKPIPSLSQLSHLFHSLRPGAFIQPDLHTFTLHAIRVSANLSLSLSNMDLGKVNLDAPHSMGTTIIGVTYNGGVVLGADSRTSTGIFLFLISLSVWLPRKFLIFSSFFPNSKP